MTRTRCITERIEKSRTGLNDNLFVHVDYDDAGRFKQLRLSEKKKDGSALDAILSAYGDLATFFIKSGLGADVSVTINFDKRGRFESVRFGGKGFEKTATALSDVATEIIKNLPNGGGKVA